jgi:uncharacterized protein
LQHLETAKELARSIGAYFTDPSGGFFDTPSDGEALIVRPKSYFDSAMPSGNGATSLFFLKLARLTSDPDLEAAALEPILQMQAAMSRQPTGFGSLNRALEQALAPHRELVVSGDLAAAETQALLKVVRQKYLPHTAIVAGEADLPLLEGRKGLPAQVFICQNMACQMPIADVTALQAALEAQLTAKPV